jgi:hypothetical protein
MIMIDRSRRLSEPLHWGRREKSAVAAVLVVLALAVVGLGAYALTSGSAARKDCIDITFASTLGGASLHACGARARVVCASAGGHKGIAEELRAACRRAGFPYIARN